MVIIALSRVYVLQRAWYADDIRFKMIDRTHIQIVEYFMQSPDPIIVANKLVTPQGEEDDGPAKFEL